MLAEVINRFNGRNFILYGGTEEHIDMIREGGGNPIAWFTSRADITTTPPRQVYRNLYNTIYDAVYLIMTHGNMGRRKVEMGITQLLRQKGVVILHGYDSFVSTGLRVMVEPYNGGVIIFSMDDMTSSIIETRDALMLSEGRDLPPVQIPLQEVDPSIAAYTHLSSVIEAREGAVPVTDEEVPISLPSGSSDELIEYKSLRSWRQRRMLLSAMDFLNYFFRNNEVDEVIVLYLGAAPADHVEMLANLYVMYRTTFHLWGDGDYPISESPSASGEYASIFIRPEEYAMDGALDVTKYIGLPIVIISYEDPDYTRSIIDQLNPLLTWTNLSIREDEEISYFQGMTRLLPWSSTNSTDIGIISSGPETTTYNGRSIHGRMRNFQSDIRPRSYNVTPDVGPVDGLCTCYDCAREVDIVKDYLSLVGDDVTADIITPLIKEITIASRPYIGRDRNMRALWSRSTLRIPPTDRHHLILYHDVPDDAQSRLNELWGSDGIRVSSMSLLEIPIQRYSVIMAYADDIPYDEVISLIREKEEGTPSLVRGVTMGQVLGGDIDTILVNMHTDFTPTYDENSDSGIGGLRVYNSFVQRVALSRIDMSPIQHLILFSMK